MLKFWHLKECKHENAKNSTVLYTGEKGTQALTLGRTETQARNVKNLCPRFLTLGIWAPDSNVRIWGTETQALTLKPVFLCGPTLEPGAQKHRF